MLNFLISNALITQTLIKNYILKSLTSAPETGHYLTFHLK